MLYPNFLNDMFMGYLRSHPHTPGRYPGCFTNSLFPGFPFFVGKLGEVLGPIFPGALWAKSLRLVTPLTIKTIPPPRFLEKKSSKNPTFPEITSQCREATHFGVGTSTWAARTERDFFLESRNRQRMVGFPQSWVLGILIIIRSFLLNHY